MYFYEILQKIMEERSMSIPDVARATGLSDSTIRSMITRKSKGVALEVAAKISNGLGIELEELNGDYSLTKIKLANVSKVEAIQGFATDNIPANNKDLNAVIFQQGKIIKYDDLPEEGQKELESFLQYLRQKYSSGR